MPPQVTECIDEWITLQCFIEIIRTSCNRHSSLRLSSTLVRLHELRECFNKQTKIDSLLLNQLLEVISKISLRIVEVPSIFKAYMRYVLLCCCFFHLIEETNYLFFALSARISKKLPQPDRIKIAPARPHILVTDHSFYFIQTNKPSRYSSLWNKLFLTLARFFGALQCTCYRGITVWKEGIGCYGANANEFFSCSTAATTGVTSRMHISNTKRSPTGTKSAQLQSPNDVTFPLNCFDRNHVGNKRVRKTTDDFLVVSMLPLLR